MEPIARPRFASADIDGNGQAEIIAGGRIGPFLPVTDPLESKQARLDVYKRTGDQLQRLASSPELHLVQDVAAGDLTGDGRAEILAVGGGRLIVLQMQSQNLYIRHIQHLPVAQAHRIAVGDLNGDGIAEIAVAHYNLEENAEIGTSTVALYAWQNNGLTLLQTLAVEGHIGDLALQSYPGQGTTLILEAGTGDEGGEALLYQMTSGSHRELWRGPLTLNRVRALNLSSLPGINRLVVGAVDGTVRIFELDASGLRLLAHGPETFALTGLCILNNPGRGLELLLGSATPHRPAIRTVPLAY